MLHPCNPSRDYENIATSVSTFRLPHSQDHLALPRSSNLMLLTSHSCSALREGQSEGLEAEQHTNLRRLLRSPLHTRIGSVRRWCLPWRSSPPNILPI